MTHASTSDVYALDNDAPEAERMLDCLSLILDEFTVSRLEAAGVPAGGRFLELGAGRGTVAGWLAERAGPNGFVLATDINPRHVRRYDGLTVLAHDLAKEDPPAGPWQVIHARLLLAHLPSRREILRRLVDVLAPGGALIVEEWGATGPGMVLHAPDPDLRLLYDRYQQALLAVFAAQGNDSSWCWQVPTVMVDAGLSDVDTQVFARGWCGNTAGTLLPVAVSSTLRDRLTSYGITGEELDRMTGMLSNPSVLLLGNLMWSHIGRKPGPSDGAV